MPLEEVIDIANAQSLAKMKSLQLMVFQHNRNRLFEKVDAFEEKAEVKKLVHFVD